MITKIHLIHFSDRPGGIEIILPKIIGSLTGFQFSAFVIRKEPGSISVYQNSGIPVSYGSMKNLVAWRKLFMYVRKYRNEIFHVFNIGPVFLLLMKMAGAKKIIYSIHGTKYWKSEFQKTVFLKLWRIALDSNIRMLANSEFSRSVFQREISPGSEIAVLYNPIDENQFYPVAKEKINGEVKIIYSGRLDKGKNLIRWIEIAMDVHNQFPHTSFTLYGDGEQRNLLNEKIKAGHAESYIHLNGLAKDISTVYREADLLLFLSEYESFGNVVVESIFSGTPVLAAPIPAMQEIFRDHLDFLLNENENTADQVCRKIKELPALKVEAVSARKDFLNRFSARHHMQFMENVYHDAGK